jgi:membrane protein implicated in regulation of membrane protease activity
MNWELFYMGCFIVGFLFTTLSFLSGTLNVHLHFPGHGHFHIGGHGGHGGARAGARGGGARTHGSHFSFFNPISLAVFLAWFGGTGYLLVHLRHIWVFAGLALSSLAGLAGASVVFFFVAKFLMSEDHTLDPADFEMVGVLGKVSSTIRKQGTGEMIFVQQGLRKACAARSDQEEQIDTGNEVVVTKYENGVAYVRRWHEMAERAGILPEEKESLQ